MAYCAVPAAATHTTGGREDGHTHLRTPGGARRLAGGNSTVLACYRAVASRIDMRARLSASAVTGWTSVTLCCERPGDALRQSDITEMPGSPPKALCQAVER